MKFNKDLKLSKNFLFLQLWLFKHKDELINKKNFIKFANQNQKPRDILKNSDLGYRSQHW